MKQQKKSWVKTLLSFAEPCKGKMILSVLCAIFSVAGGFVPFWAVYEILLLFINRTATLSNIMLWCLVGVGGYLIRVICFGISTILAHISAYTILEGIRLKIANRLMRASLGEVMGRRIGYLKNIIMDKVEDLEPPLAHMIPELTSNLLLPIAIFIWMLAIDWRLGLAVLIAPVLAMIPMFFLMRNYNSQYAAYMEAKYSLQGTTQSRYLTEGFRPSDFPCDIQAVACSGNGGNHQIHHPPLVVKGYILPSVEVAGNLADLFRANGFHR